MSHLAIWFLVLLAGLLAARLALRPTRRVWRRRYTSDRRQWWAG
jgi:hypothetical protein